MFLLGKGSISSSPIRSKQFSECFIFIKINALLSIDFFILKEVYMKKYFCGFLCLVLLLTMFSPLIGKAENI